MGGGARTHVAIGLLTALAVWPCAARASTTPGGIEFDPKTQRETFLLSRSYYDGIPNGPSRNAAFSGDRQLATRIAYESDASDIVPGDTNGATDVFVVRRAKPYTRDGEPWRILDTQLVSVARDGGPANGPSYAPDLDGDQRVAPRCVAFVSKASNLVAGDTNGQPDAFVADLKSGRITRVSVNAAGKQADGPTYDVKIDGECGRVAFTARAPNLALTSTKRAAWRSAVTSPAPRATRQVYVRVLTGDRDNRELKGLTFLASANAGGRAGDKDSFEPSLAAGAGGCPARCGDFFGEAVAFSSDATNLSAADRNGATDIYLRRMERTMKPTQPVSLARPVGGLRFATQLVSATPQGRAGNGPSRRPAANDRADVIAFDTRASDLLAGDTNGVSDVARALVTRRGVTHEWVSKSADIGEPGNADSVDATITRPGSPIFFESDASNLAPVADHDRNEIRDVFFWNVVSRNASIQSRGSDQRILGMPDAFLDGVGPIERADANVNPAVSYYGNYMLFETGNPRTDLTVTAEDMPDYMTSPAQAAVDGRARPELHQVYLRYIGPR